MTEKPISIFEGGHKFEDISIEDALAYPGSFIPFPGGRTLLIKEWQAIADCTGMLEIKLRAYVFGKEIEKEKP